MNQTVFRRFIASVTIGMFLFFPLALVAQAKLVEKRVDSLMKLMTLNEKIGQLNQYSGRDATGPVNERRNNLYAELKSGAVGSMLNVKGVKDTREIQALALQSRLHIPLLFGLDVIHGYKTVFPIPLGESSSWDLELMRQTAHSAARESAASGINWTFAPMVDVARDPRWGRVTEGAGEDPFLGSAIARARVLGLQGNKLGGTDAVMACAKHFAAYGAVIAGRDYNDVDMSLQQLWNIYLPPFKVAVDAGAATFMTSFSTLNGIPATGNQYLLRDVLKKQWQYPGFVVSDWGSIAEMTNWGYTANLKDAGLKALTAGVDMDMESRAYQKFIPELLKEGKINIGMVDDAVKRILRKKFELGLFEDPYKFCDAAREQQVLNDPATRQLAREAAKKSAVLLKNNHDVLPLKKSSQSIALIGPLVKAKRDLAGSWTVYADTASIVSLYDGMLNKKAQNVLGYAKGCNVQGDSKDGFAQALDLARRSDVVVMALGESWDMSGESKSRSDINVPGVQVELFNQIKALGKPVIVVLMAGRPLIFKEIADKADAIIYAWWSGSEGGNGMADVLYGDYDPSARLPVTFPRSAGQIPIYYNARNTGKPVTDPKDIKYKSAYIDELNSPQYAFGFGLSYTSFAYSDLKLTKTELRLTDSCELSFKVTNTGKVAGEETAQLYINEPVASVTRPVKELRGFQKVFLQPGESRTINFKIKKDVLAFYNQALVWTIEPGLFNLMISSSSDQILLKTTLHVLDK